MVVAHRTLALLALLLSRCSCFSSLATSQLRKLELWLDLPSAQTDVSLVRKFLRTELGASDALPLCAQTVRPHSVEAAPIAKVHQSSSFADSSGRPGQPSESEPVSSFREL